MRADGFAASPFIYPGALLETSYLLLCGGRAVVLEQRPGRRLGQSWVDLQAEQVGSARTSLDQALDWEAAAPMERRHAVLAIGSNAAPAQLARKLAGGAVGPVVPVVRAEASALQVLLSAHLNRNGYVPAAPARAPADHRLACFVTLLDDAQLERVDASEPNYQRVTLDPQQHVVRLGNGELLSGCQVYRSRHGVLVDSRLASSTGAMPDQRALLTSLIEVLPPLQDRGLTADSLVAALRDAALDSAEVTRAMQAHLQVREAGLAELDADA